MSDTKQTIGFGGMPGPYQLDGMRITAIDHGKRHVLATLEFGKFTTSAILAHGKLFAAAPQLLDALVMALPYVETALEDKGYKPGTVDRMVKQIRDAIALTE